MTSPDITAVATYPQLRHLIDLRAIGWTFQPIVDDNGVNQVYGFRHWPGGWIDLLIIHHLTNTAAARATHDGHLVWTREGGFIEVIDHLADLPAPHEPLAPTLVIGRVPTLWTQ
ncbi:hypothetical protein [Actinokineospora globicatena]|uniref:hypothetical protein n=1 Tax=Actinokineospora globicatena TaxID=103729 RepID=UPI0020A4955D|nr:hypothetical protein [Actinokineospora globicatena]MCP2304030.1 hypothetical protein [Actinokineospora globicatena]GLW78620.1 hypothetical protein Aglo01_31020 [Actinokineospora globicatena]GLW84713.1 hypothetical protein Aglo02_23530 [Actinokineospora globicatena]